MLRIAYLFHYCGNDESGVFKKIFNQAKAWKSQGADVRLFMLTSGDSAKAFQGKEYGVPLEIETYGPYLGRFKQSVKRIGEWHPDVVYFRYNSYYPALAKLFNRFPFVMEINTDDVQEFRLTGSGVRYWYNLLTRGILFRKARGLTFLSSELRDKKRFAKYNKPSIVIGDAINLAQMPLLPAPDNLEPKVVLIATGKPWHGIDKLVKLAQAFPHWHFDLIGVKNDEAGPSIPSNMVCHGFLAQDRYQSIAAEADVAVSSLALHRIEIDEISPLKLREYLAYGIPSIIGYRDTDFPDPVPFILELPNTENNVINNLDRIEYFVSWAKGKRVAREDIAHLDAGIKEKQRVEFMQGVIESEGRGM